MPYYVDIICSDCRRVIMSESRGGGDVCPPTRLRLEAVRPVTLERWGPITDYWWKQIEAHVCDVVLPAPVGDTANPVSATGHVDGSDSE